MNPQQERDEGVPRDGGLPHLTSAGIPPLGKLCGIDRKGAVLANWHGNPRCGWDAQVYTGNVKWLAIGVGLAAATFVVSGQDALPDWVLRLSRMKHHLRDNFQRIPDYVCREDIVRYRKSPGAARTVKLDSLQFDVAYVDHKELWAQPGTGAFEDREISSYVSSGMLGTGAFASLPIALFVYDNARVTPHRDAADQPASVSGWDYEIPAFLSGYRIVRQGTSATVGVRGAFWVDPESMDLIRIVEQAVDPPPQTGMISLSSAVEYARTGIGRSRVLLPQSAEATVVDLDGAEMRNDIQFSGCREYTAESTVHFGDTVEPPPVKKK